MKIDLKLSNDMVMMIALQLRKIYEMPKSVNTHQNVYKSIGFDLSDKFDVKAKALVKKSGLFETKKAKVTLKFHEAWALEKILIDLKPIIQNEFQQTMTQSVINYLNQKLA